VTRRVLAIGGLLLLVVVVGLTLCAGWLINTEAGLHFVLRRLETLSSVSITTRGARGTIGGPLAFDSLVIDHEAVRIEARDLRLEPELTSLLSRTISITRAEAGAIEVTLHSREPQPPSEPHFMPHLLRLVVGTVDLRRVQRASPTVDAVGPAAGGSDRVARLGRTDVLTRIHANCVRRSHPPLHQGRSNDPRKRHGNSSNLETSREARSSYDAERPP